MPPTIHLWEALEKTENHVVRNFAISEQLENLDLSLRAGPGNSDLRSSFIAHLQSSDFETRQRMLDFLSRSQSSSEDTSDTSAAEQLLQSSEVQDALASAFTINEGALAANNASRKVAARIKDQKAQALALMRDSASRRTPRTEAILAANPLIRIGRDPVSCIGEGLAGIAGH